MPYISEIYHQPRELLANYLVLTSCLKNCMQLKGKYFKIIFFGVIYYDNMNVYYWNGYQVEKLDIKQN